MTPKLIENIAYQIYTLNPEMVYIPNSLMGSLIERLKHRLPNIKIITFFHNIEVDFFRSLTKNKFKYVASIICGLVKNREKKTVKYSDKVITLNKRDSERLYFNYGRMADLLLPSSFEDNYRDNKRAIEDKINLLFVGFNFFANIEGISWFVDNVMNRIDRKYHLYIVGKGMERTKNRLERENVTVVGFAEDIRAWYEKSDIVVLPIFSGSGMKTKTAEAMMYAKPILASKESFEGYEIDNYSSIGGLCTTADEYIDSILKIDRTLMEEMGKNSRDLFLKKYSNAVAMNTLKNFIEKC